MESLRDVRRKMEREIEKGRATPLKFEKMGLSENSYKEITSAEQMGQVLNWLLRLNEYRTGEATVANNVYMQMRPLMKKPEFNRTKSVMERMIFYADITRYIRKIGPMYSGDCYMEEAVCYFSIPEEELQKCKYTYKDRETFGFLLSNAFILGLYCECESARADLAINHQGETNKPSQKLMALSEIKEVLFQCLLLDDVWQDGDYICAKLYTIYCMEE